MHYSWFQYWKTLFINDPEVIDHENLRTIQDEDGGEVGARGGGGGRK